MKNLLKKVIRLRINRGSHPSYVFWTPISSVRIRHRWDGEARWFAGRDTRLNYLELQMALPFEKMFVITGPIKSYRELVEAPEYLENLDWIIDEFDSSFNDLAVASLKYHLDFSICDNESRREKYEDLIERLSEKDAEFTDEEIEIIHARDTGDFAVDINRERTPEEKAVYDAYWKRDEEYHARINQARHDFVDIMRYLWS
jgi:hypothetical protein